jgi:hypothetical protein
MSERPEFIEEKPWPKHGNKVNEWYSDIQRFIRYLCLFDKEPWWSMDSELKYLDIRIDTRDNGFLLFDRDRNKVEPERVIKALNKWNGFRYDKLTKN